MKTIDLDPKTHSLLSSNMGVLHRESEEWISKLLYWKDDMNILYNICHLLDFTQENIHRDALALLKDDVIIHKKLLSMKEQKRMEFPVSEYKDMHRRLLSRIEAMADHHKSLKRVSLAWYEHV